MIGWVILIAIVLIIVFMAGFSFWVFLKYRKSKKIKNTLFEDSYFVFFQKMVKNLNPFLIVKRKNGGKNPGENPKKLSGKEFEIGDVPTEVSLDGGMETDGTEGSGEIVEGGSVGNKNSSAGKKDKKKQNMGGLRKKLEINGEETKKLLKRVEERKKLEKNPQKIAKAPVIRISNFEELSNKLKNKEIDTVLDYFKTKKYSLLIKRISNRRFKSKKEIINFLKEEIINFLSSSHGELKDRISALRKKGKDVTDLELRLMVIPLKINVFKASFYRKDFDKVVKLLDKIENETKGYEAKLAEEQKIKENQAKKQIQAKKQVPVKKEVVKKEIKPKPLVKKEIKPEVKKPPVKKDVKQENKEKKQEIKK
jgi:hypothetical protein